MSEQPSSTQVNPEADEPEGDTEGEFRSLFADSQEGKQRLLGLAMAAESAGNADVAKIYREIAGTVMTLFADLAAATGGAVVNIEEAVGDLQRNSGRRIASGLLEEDANQYLALFDQYLRLLDGLTAMVPTGVEGDAQRDVFATMRRMTVGMIDFTKSLIFSADDDDDDDEDEDEDEGEGEPSA
jgi:hypothetical protein